ncbi:hypothetical protein GCK32_022550, partial [Trichostrongylus colubriformis]
LCSDFDEQNLAKAKQFFFSNVISYFQDINQYSGDNRNAATRNGLGIPKACEIMTDATVGDEMDRVKRVVSSLYNTIIQNMRTPNVLSPIN